MTRLTTVADAESAAARAAAEIARALTDALERRGVAHLALAGGNTPRRAYELLAGLLADWSAVELWYGDERCVGPDDPESNHRLVAESLLARIPGAPPREHRIAGELGAEQAATAYEVQLRAHVPPAGEPALDLALLGIGEDGHTASLFPGHPEVEDGSGALCLPVHHAPKPPGSGDAQPADAARRAALPVARDGRGKGRRARRGPRGPRPACAGEPARVDAPACPRRRRRRTAGAARSRR